MPYRQMVWVVRRLAMGLLSCLMLTWCSLAPGQVAGPGLQPLPGTEPLTRTGDIAETLVAGVDRFLLHQIERSTAGRARHWNRDFRSEAAYNASVEPNRRRLAHILGVRDVRVPFDGPQDVITHWRPELLGGGEKYNIHSVRWPAFGDVTGEALLLEPSDHSVAFVVVIPAAGQLPEQLAGLLPGVPEESQVARRLAESGCRVIVPSLIDRTVEPRNGRAKLTNETVASLPGADSKIARQEQGKSTWDPLNASELAPNSADGLIPSLIAWAKSQPPGNAAIVSVLMGTHKAAGDAGFWKAIVRTDSASFGQEIP